jgi:hypothetical protein
MAAACVATGRDDPSCVARPAIAERGRAATVLLGADSVTVSAFVITDSEPPYRNATYIRLVTDVGFVASQHITMDSTVALVCGVKEIARSRVLPLRLDSTLLTARVAWFEAVSVPAVTWWKASYDLQLRVRDPAGYAAEVRVAPLELLIGAFRDTVALRRSPLGLR